MDTLSHPGNQPPPPQRPPRPASGSRLLTPWAGDPLKGPCRGCSPIRRCSAYLRLVAPLLSMIGKSAGRRVLERDARNVGRNTLRQYLENASQS